MDTVSEVAKILPPGRQALAEDAPSGAQVENIYEHRDLVTAFLNTPEENRFYKGGGRPVKPLNVRPTQGGAQLPGAMSRYEQAIKNDGRYRMGNGDMAFQWMGTEIDGDVQAFPTVDVLLARDQDLRGPGLSTSMGSYDNHLPVQTTLAGIPLQGGRTRAQVEGAGITAEEKKRNWEAQARAIESRIRLIGIVVPVDSEQSANGRTVAHIGGPKSYRNVWKASYFPGDMMAWRVLPQSELDLCQLPEAPYPSSHRC